jgi:hypothetical protein
MTQVPTQFTNTAGERGEASTERPFTVEEVLALPVTVDLMTTARALGISKTVAYHLARTGRYPVPLYKVGARYRCLRSALLAHLGIADATASHRPSPLSQ